MASPRAPRNDATAAQVIYDFQVDVWRVAVSIYNHALTCVEIKFRAPHEMSL